jgi:hypothetical protein
VPELKAAEPQWIHPTATKPELKAADTFEAPVQCYQEEERRPAAPLVSAAEPQWIHETAKKPALRAAEPQWIHEQSLRRPTAPLARL